MNQKECKRIKEVLSAKNGGQLRKQFYQRNGLPKQGLLSNEAIYTKLDIDLSDANDFEKHGIRQCLGSGLSKLKSQAIGAKLGWMDWERTKTVTFENAKGTIVTKDVSIALHGFLDDIAKLEENAAKFERISENLVSISDTTSDISKTEIRRIRKELNKKAS